MGRSCVQEVTNFIVWDSHEAGSYLSLAKLQKLLYFAQARHLALYCRPLFLGRFEAWSHGPVLRSVYNRFEKYGWRNIDEQVYRPILDAETERFLKNLLDELGALDARALEAMTRRDDAWIAARQGAPDCVDGRWEGLISECLMREVQLRQLDRDAVTI